MDTTTGTSPGVLRRPPFGSNPLVGERGSDTRNRILAAALDVFAECGFADARVELITEQAGCSRPAFYQYFESKEDVFWALAGELGRELVTLAKSLDRVTADAAGLAHFTEWIGRFMKLHEAWAPVFASFQAAARQTGTDARASEGIATRTGRALLQAFGLPETARNETLVNNLFSVLIRCSFYAEQAPADVSPQPFVEAVAQLFHRILAGPVDGVNVLDRDPGRVRRVEPLAPEAPVGDTARRARGEKTRQRLLAAGAAVLPSRGYHDTRVDDIVAAAGVSHGTFYRYFANKDDFFRVLAESAASRMIRLVDRLDLEAEPDELRAWLRDWLAAYQADGGVISTWQEMQANEELAAFSKQIAAAVFTRLVRKLRRRDFGNAVVDATALLALIERVPYNVYTLRYTTEDDAVENMTTAIRRGFLALAD